jgi:hypothetical protein
MSFDSQYVWVVVCKNQRFHKRQNLFFGHKIPLGETDSVMPPPALDDLIRVRCDDCGQEYAYHPKDLVRMELELPDTFAPHPFFAQT